MRHFIPVLEPATFDVRLTYGTYTSSSRSEPHPRAGQAGVDGRPFPSTRQVQVRRTHHEHRFEVRLGDRIGAPEPIPVEGLESGLKLHLTARKRSDNSLVISIMAVNHKVVGPAAIPANDDAFFQVGLEIVHQERRPVFVPIDRDVGISPDDPEMESMELLFRHRRAFALGHGVAGDWIRDERLSKMARPIFVRTAAIPEHELKPINRASSRSAMLRLHCRCTFCTGASRRARC